MRPSKPIAALLVVLQFAWSLSIGTYQAAAEIVVQSAPQAQIIPISNAALIPSVLSGAKSSILAVPDLPTTTSSPDALDKSLQVPGVLEQKQILALPVSVQDISAHEIGLSKTVPISDDSAVKAGQPSSEGFSAGLSKTTQRVGKALELPGFTDGQASSESSASAAKTLFNALLDEQSSSADETPSAASGAAMGDLQSRQGLGVAAKGQAAAVSSNVDVPSKPVMDSLYALHEELRNAARFAKIAAITSFAVLGLEFLAFTPALAPYLELARAAFYSYGGFSALAQTAGAVGSVILSGIGIPQIIHNFKAGEAGAKDLAIASTLIWFAGAAFLSVSSLGVSVPVYGWFQSLLGAQSFWNIANLAGVIESTIILAQINYYKGDRKELRSTLLTLAAVLAPLPLAAFGVFMPVSAWASLAFSTAMSLFWVLNWPQYRLNYEIYKKEARVSKGVSPFYPALLLLGSCLHLYAAFMSGNMPWVKNAVIAILTSSLALGQILAPRLTNTVFTPLMWAADKAGAVVGRLRPGKAKPSEAQLAKARELVLAEFSGYDYSRFHDDKAQEHLADFLRRAALLPAHSVIYLEAPTAAGKSTLAEGLEKALPGRIKVFPVDRYFKSGSDAPLDAQGRPDFDQPDSLYLRRAAQDIHLLLAGGRVNLPYHDMSKNETILASGEFMQLEDNESLVVDSTYALHEKLRKAAEDARSLGVYLTAPAAVRLARRLKRDIAERGISVSHNLLSWGTILRNEHRYIQPLRDYADIRMNLTGEDELRALPESYAQILAQEWAEKGYDDEETRLFLEVLRSTLHADNDGPVPFDVEMSRGIGGKARQSDVQSVAGPSISR